jgi:hypothetical protein
MIPNNEKTGIVLSFHMGERKPDIPIGKPGAPLLAWGLCIIAALSAVSAYLALRGMA